MSSLEISQRPFPQGYSIGSLLAGRICIPLDAFLSESASTRRRIMWISLLIVDTSSREFSPAFKILNCFYLLFSSLIFFTRLFFFSLVRSSGFGCEEHSSRGRNGGESVWFWPFTGYLYWQCVREEDHGKRVCSFVSNSMSVCTSSEEGNHEISSVLQHALPAKKGNMKSLRYCNMLSSVYFHCNRVSSAL